MYDEAKTCIKNMWRNRGFYGKCWCLSESTKSLYLFSLVLNKPTKGVYS